MRAGTAALRVFILGVLLESVNGCSFTSSYKAGDARLRETRNGSLPRTFSIGVIPRRSVEIALPEDALANVHTSHYQIRGYPPALAPRLRLQVLDRISATIAAERAVGPWPPSIVRITARTPAGALLATQIATVGRVPLNNAASSYWSRIDGKRWGSSFPLLAIEQAVQGRSDYDLEIAVEKTWRGRRESIRITGEATAY